MSTLTHQQRTQVKILMARGLRASDISAQTGIPEGDIWAMLSSHKRFFADPRSMEKPRKVAPMRRHRGAA